MKLLLKLAYVLVSAADWCVDKLFRRKKKHTTTISCSLDPACNEVHVRHERGPVTDLLTN